MKIKIDSDAFNIVERIKLIDKGYFVLYNLSSKKFEIHNKKYKNTYCLTVPYPQLDARTIRLIWETSIVNYKNILKELNDENNTITKINIEKQKEVNDYKVREMFKYSKIKTEQVNSGFKTEWL